MRATGTFVLPRDRRTVTGRTTFSIGQLADVGSLIGETIEGALQGTLDIASDGGHLTGRVHATASGASYAGTKARTLAIDGHVIDPFGKPVKIISKKSPNCKNY